MSQSQEFALHMFELQTEFALKYGLDLSGRTVQLIGEIDEEAFAYIDSVLSILENQSKAAITLKINSPGGSVYDALAIVGRLKASKCKIVTEAYGACMSAATVILAAGAKRRMSKYSWFMWHESSYDAGGTHSQVKHYADQVDREEYLWCKAMEEFTGVPQAKWENAGKAGKDYYLTAQQCLDMGIVDEIF